MELFSNSDFHQVSIRTISEKSGVSLGTIYKYFSTKEDLLFSILRAHINEIGRLSVEHIKGLKSSKEIFRKILWVTMDYYDRHPHLAVCAFITVPARTWMQQKAYRIERVSWEEFAQNGTEQGDIDPAIDSRRAQDIYYMVCYRIIMQWHYFGSRWKLVDAVEKDFDIFWKMFEAK